MVKIYVRKSLFPFAYADLNVEKRRSKKGYEICRLLTAVDKIIYTVKTLWLDIITLDLIVRSVFRHYCLFVCKTSIYGETAGTTTGLLL